MLFEIMSSDISVAGEMDFVASSAVLDVLLNPPGVAGLGFANAVGNQWFGESEGILLTGIYVNIPYGFGQGSGACSFELAWEDGAGFQTAIPELSGASSLVLPNLCHLEIPGAGLYVPGVPLLGRQRLVLVDFVLNVSQVNLPPALDGETVAVQVHFRLGHTDVLTAIA